MFLQSVRHTVIEVINYFPTRNLVIKLLVNLVFDVFADTHHFAFLAQSGIASLAPRQPAAGGVLFVRHVVELYPFMLNPMRSIGIIFIGNKSFSDFSSNLCIAQIFAKNSTDKPIEKLLILMSIKSSYVPFAFGHLEKK